MKREDKLYQAYVNILKEELVPAMGCTEPVAIAYGAAYAKEILGELPKKAVVEVSGNIIKNVKSVVVPNTEHMRGIEAAAAAGIVAGKASKMLEVISSVSDEQKRQIKAYMDTAEIQVVHAEVPFIFYIQITLYSEENQVTVRIVNYHTNIVYVEKNGVAKKDNTAVGCQMDSQSDRSCLTVTDIIDFVQSMDIKDVEPLIQRQIDYNYKIAEEGMANDYGANVGRVLLKTYGDDVKNRARAMAAAASDARMNGCELPVVIVSGSGNQGIAASLPIIVYAKELGVSQEQLIRAVTLSDLIALHQKSGIGRLSAYCGAVCAGIGSGAGIAYLMGGSIEEISHTIVNALAIISGIICDGAKSSCAAKIATSVDAGILGYYMYKEGQQFLGGDGIVKKGVEATIDNVGRLAREGMKETDKEIIKLMIES